jgi:hypothetical protein
MRSENDSKHDSMPASTNYQYPFKALMKYTSLIKASFLDFALKQT